MTFFVLDQFPQERPLLERCIRCGATELNRPNKAHPDKVIGCFGVVPVPWGDTGFSTVDVPIHFCSSCWEEGGAEIGMASAEKAADLRRKNRDLGAENRRLREKLEKFESAASLQVEALST